MLYFRFPGLSHSFVIADSLLTWVLCLCVCSSNARARSPTLTLHDRWWPTMKSDSAGYPP